MADTGRLDELKRKFDENPKRYFAPLANEYRKAGDPDLAIELCRTYLPQQPTHMSGYIVYGQALHDAGHADESAAVFKQALTLDPENIIALRHLGDISRAAGDKIGAMRWYGKVLELDPRNEEISAYITSLAQSGSTPASSASERQAPPAVRPEPEHDDFAVRLEDIVWQPDVEQAPFTPERPVHEPSSPLREESDEPFQVTEWPAAPDTAPLEPSRDSGGHESSPARDGPWHADGAPHGLPADHGATVDEPSEPLRLSDFMPDEDAALAPTPDEIADQVAARAAVATADHAAEPASPNRDESPFVTETMAELYMQQGLRSEALFIYRQLALKRDDPALRQRIAEIESAASGADTRETVREFFARIGTKRPNERVELAVDRASPLSALLGSGQPDADDLSAAQRLSGAFGNPRSSDSHS